MLFNMYSWAAKDASELEVKCQHGKTPLDYARENNQRVIVRFLENKIHALHHQGMASETSSSPIPLDKPLSDANKQHIFDSLRQLGRLKPDVLNQSLVASALANMVFPSAFNAKLKPLQMAYQSNKTSTAIELLLAEAIRTYLKEEGAALFTELLNGVFIPDLWNKDLMRKLAGYDIIIIENPYVEATIQNGKIYWCINFGNKVHYRRPSHEPILSQAIIQNRVWRLTWKEFRHFKDAGKRTGTVSITKERFVTTIRPFLTEAWATSIWQELRTVGILDRKDRLSQAWYPFSLDRDMPFRLKLRCLGDNKNKIYQKIADTLQHITRNQTYAEIIAPGMDIYRPARVSKTWGSTGLVQNCKPDSDEFVLTKLWDVGVARELRGHAVTQKPACEIDHIPSTSKIMSQEDMDYWDREFQNCDMQITKIQALLPQNNGHNLRNTYQGPHDYQTHRDNLLLRKQELAKGRKESAKGLSFWGIDLRREVHKAGDTNGASQAEQENLDFYSSVSTYICKLKEELDSTMFLQALGAFRYMYARMCKPHGNIGNQLFISNTPNTLFGHSEKNLLDALFVNEMQRWSGSGDAYPIKN